MILENVCNKYPEFLIADFYYNFIQLYIFAAQKIKENENFI